MSNTSKLLKFTINKNMCIKLWEIFNKFHWKHSERKKGYVLKVAAKCSLRKKDTFYARDVKLTLRVSKRMYQIYQVKLIIT